MKLVCFAVAALASVVAVSPAVAQLPGGGGQPEVANGADTPAQNRVICRSAKVIGSRLKPARVCKTAKQWEADQAEQRSGLERNQNQRQTFEQ
jgi:hypothetical protein